MRKLFLMVLPIMLILTGCGNDGKDVEPDPKYEAVARLYTEMLWRPIEEADNKVLELCNDTVQERIKTTSETAQELLRRLKYLTRDEVSELVGPLDEYYERMKNDWIGQQEMAAYREQEYLSIEDYQPIQVLTQETYEVHNEDIGTYVVLENNNAVYFKPPIQYSGNYTCELVTFDEGIYKYRIKLEEGSNFDLYLDVQDGIVVRMQEHAN